MSGNSVFIDTNVLVYATVKRSPLHILARECIQRLWDQDTIVWISRQVIREYLATVTRPQSFAVPMSPTTAIVRIRTFTERFNIADETTRVTDNLLMLMHDVTIGGKQIHDANIVATMLAHRIDTLLTHNTQDFNRYAAHITVIPLENNTQ